MNSPALQNIALLASRILLSLIFIVAGFNKIPGYSGTGAYMESMGVPSILLPLVILTELVGGLAILIGYKTRLVALLLAGFTIIAAVIFHRDFADQIQTIMFMKNLAIAGGFLGLFASGAGALSVDARSA